MVIHKQSLTSLVIKKVLHKEIVFPHHLEDDQSVNKSVWHIKNTEIIDMIRYNYKRWSPMQMSNRESG